MENGRGIWKGCAKDDNQFPNLHQFSLQEHQDIGKVKDIVPSGSCCLGICNNSLSYDRHYPEYFSLFSLYTYVFIDLFVSFRIFFSLHDISLLFFDSITTVVVVIFGCWRIPYRSLVTKTEHIISSKYSFRLLCLKSICFRFLQRIM